jgi:hypothetical protein
MVSGRPLWAGPLYHVFDASSHPAPVAPSRAICRIAELVTRAAPTWLASKQIQVSRRPASLDW